MSSKRARAVAAPGGGAHRKTFWDAGFGAKAWAMQHQVKVNGRTQELWEWQMTALAFLGNFTLPRDRYSDYQGLPVFEAIREWFDELYVIAKHDGTCEVSTKDGPFPSDGIARFCLKDRKVFSIQERRAPHQYLELVN